MSEPINRAEDIPVRAPTPVVSVSPVVLPAPGRAVDSPPGFDPDVAAPIIATYLHGLFRTALVSHDRPQLERQIDVFLTGLGC